MDKKVLLLKVKQLKKDVDTSKDPIDESVVALVNQSINDAKEHYKEDLSDLEEIKTKCSWTEVSAKLGQVIAVLKANLAKEIKEDGNRYLPQSAWREQAFYETYKSQISLLIEGFKLLGWANGGGAVAMLTVMGAKNLSNFVPVAGKFAGGLAFCIAGLFVAYFAQMSFLKYLNEPKDTRWKWGHIISFGFATAFAGLSIGAFASAVSSGANSFSGM